MTTSRIQHILTGLKGEIAREKDRERVIHLCEMGLYFNDLLLYGYATKICSVCGDQLPLKLFSRSDASICKGCWNKNAWDALKVQAGRRYLKYKGALIQQV